MTAPVSPGHAAVMLSLDLRFTGGEVPESPPDVAAFVAAEPALLREQQADHDDGSVLADLLAAYIVDAHLRLVVAQELVDGRLPVFVPLRSAPIPAISAELAGSPITTAFLLADHIDGHLAWTWTPARPRRGAALVLAACIPLVLPDVALAQQPAAAPATPVVAPAAPPAAGMPQLEAILRAMNGRDAIVFAAGVRVTGKIVGIDGDFVTIVDAERQGKIAMIPKAQITEVRGQLAKPPAPELPTGLGQLVPGGILVGVGTPLMIWGLANVAISPSSFFSYGFQVIPATILLAIGIPHLVIGSRRRRVYLEAKQNGVISRRLTPSLGRTPGGGWTGGLTLRF